MKVLRRTQFGNPILRSKARLLSSKEILSAETKELIVNMRFTLENKKYGVGLAAPQVGVSASISVIAIKPTPTRPELKPLNMTIINPSIVKTYGSLKPMWEGCISGTELYGKAMRYDKIRLHWFDEDARQHEEDFESILAQVLQHETDHLNGILFVDRVKDTKSYITFSEYKKLRKREAKQKVLKN